MRNNKVPLTIYVDPGLRELMLNRAILENRSIANLGESIFVEHLHYQKEQPLRHTTKRTEKIAA
jgi:hypothetical protein